MGMSRKKPLDKNESTAGSDKSADNSRTFLEIVMRRALREVCVRI
jgi:hypothetical protein